MIFFFTFFFFVFSIPIFGQKTKATLKYNLETSAIISNGNYAPLWFSANQYGLTSHKSKQNYLKAGLFYNQNFKRHWNISGELDLAGGYHLSSDFWIHQAYIDISWKMISISVGSKEQNEFPFEINKRLSSGRMLEGINARPIPQVKVSIKNYIPIPGIHHWVAFKGHLSYGWFTDSNWQDDFTAPKAYFTKNVLYHSKSLMLKLGNKKRLPAEFEIGILMNSQFGGKRYLKMKDGSNKLINTMPHNLKAYWKAFLPAAGGADAPVGEQVNVEGNMQGSWNFAFTYYLNDWKFKAYLEHYFDDHSQMFWEYGRWKDGLLGMEIYLPSNSFISTILWEGISTKDQTGPILYDSLNGSFTDVQMSGKDDYFNHYLYQAWQHYGNNIGNPLIPGPAYNTNGIITFRSNRIRANHLGISGNPSKEWEWRILTSFARHWGTYSNPLDSQRKQFNGMLELTYLPDWAKGWSLTAALGLDRGNFLGNSTGGLITLRKIGGFNL